jgi:uncharacterized membrane protein
MGRVPVVRGLYAVAKQMSNVFFSSDSRAAFKKVVLVPFPAPGTQTLGFVTGTYSPGETIVYVPTAPNPTSGYVLIFKNELVQDTELHVDDALKMVLSCGAVGKSPSGTSGGTG